jgi:hypothetical protein
MIVGNEPRIVGRFTIAPPEMMFIQYMPIAMPGTGFRIPKNLECFKPILAALNWADVCPEDYVYVSAKHLYVDRDRCFNRPGWHVDGFGTDDLNYIWTNRAPTEFCIQPFDVSDDCDESMAQMSAQALPENVRIYGDNMLVRLDNTVVHRPPATIEPGFRIFLKISISRDRYNLIGNAHNHLFDYDWPMMPRSEKRNHPAAA